MKLGITNRRLMFLSFSMLLSVFLGMGDPLLASGQDYSKALKYGVAFYDANKCGPEVEKNNVFDWRKNCHEEDGHEVGLDLSGGYHDSGDHVKFGMTQNYAASILGWSYYSYKSSIVQAGVEDKLLNTLKHFTDYLLKCYPSANKFYYQVGSGYSDHDYWGSPEAQTTRRNVEYYVDLETPGSDIVGGASAALTIMYLNYKEIDASYAETCLKAAQNLYTLGKSNPGLARYEGNFYASTSYLDDLAWAATWLYEATGNKQYLREAEEFVKGGGSEPFKTNWTMCWDDLYVPTSVKLYELTGKEIYKEAVAYNIKTWQNEVMTTKGGLKFINPEEEWGPLRYAVAEAAIAIKYYEMTGDVSAKKMALSQINYALGDNPANLSYLVGYGNQYPKYPHHRAAYTYENHTKSVKYLVKGYLVGGPNTNDQYEDDTDNYKGSEGGIDSNAGLIMALSGMIRLEQLEKATNVSTPSELINEGNSELVSKDALENKGASEEVLDNNRLDVMPNEKINVEVATQVEASISQVYHITANEPVDLSKLSIRFYFEKTDEQAMNFWCDHAALQLNVAPWYEEMTSSISSYFGEEAGKHYLQINIGKAYELTPEAGSLTLQVRFANADWTNITGFNDLGVRIQN